MEARLVISASDQTAGAFNAVERHAKDLGSQLKAIGRDQAALGRGADALAAYGKVARDVDSVAAAMARAAKEAPGLKAPAAALAAGAEAAKARMRELEADASRIAAAGGKIDMMRASQAGFAKARAEFAGAKASVLDFARGVEAADAKVLKLRADLASAKAAKDNAWKAVELAPRPTRADSADAARFAAVQAAHAQAMASFAAATHEHTDLRSAIIEAEAERAKLGFGYRKAQAGVGQAAGALDREKSAMTALRGEVESVAGPMATLSGAEARLKAMAEGAASAMGSQVEAMRHAAQAGDAVMQHSREHALQQRAAEMAAHRVEHGQEHHGVKNYLLTSAAMAVSAHEIINGMEAVFERGAEYQHRLVALQNAGRTPEEIVEMNAASHAALRNVPTATLTGNLEILNETVGAFGSVQHAMEHLDFMNKAATTLHAVAGDKIGGSPGEMGNQFARFFEMRGTAGNGEVFEHEASEMMKSMIFTGGNVNPRELLNFAQQAKSSLQNYDLHFLSRIAPSLIGEVGGDRAGTQANAFNSVILGKANDKKQAEAWLKYGLIDPKQMTKKGDAFTGWTGGAIYHTDEFLRNPLQAIEERLLPALAAKGVDINSPLELTKVLGTLFRNINAAAWANELAQPQNRKRLHKDDALIGQVEDLDAIYKRLLKTDPKVAMQAVKGAFGSLLTTLSSPLMEPAARNLSGLATTLNALAITAHDHPVAATVAGLATAAGSLYAAGRLSYGLLNGFGNAALGPAAGEMVAAGHEQLVAGRTMMGAAEAMRLGALEHDLPGAVPVGKGAGRAAGRVALREGEVLAEGAAEAAIGQKVVGAVEGALAGGLKGGIAVEALEVAATGALTMSVGSVALLAGSAILTIGALSNALDPKKRASDDPNFGKAFPVTGFDPNDPNLPRDPASLSEEERKEQAKPWWNRGKGHARGSVASQKDTDQPGHWEPNRNGRGMHWALEDRRGPKNPGFFTTAPLGPDGMPTVPMPNGLMPDPHDRRTWAHFGLNTPTPDPDLYVPSDKPLPPVRPAPPPVLLPPPPAVPPAPVDANAALRAYVAGAPTLGRPPALPAEGGPVPVRVVSTSVDPHTLPGGFTPAGVTRDFSLGNKTGNFSSPGMGTDGTFGPFSGRHAPAFTPVHAHAASLDVAPHVDLSGLDGVAGKAAEAKTALEAVGAVDISPRGSLALLDAIIAKARQAKAELAGIGAAGGGYTTGSVGPSRIVADPGVGRSR